MAEIANPQIGDRNSPARPVGWRCVQEIIRYTHPARPLIYSAHGAYVNILLL